MTPYQKQKEKKILKLFFKFLKENHAFMQYRENLAMAIKKGNTMGFFDGIQIKIINEDTMRRETLNELLQELINYSFIWSKTKQGHKFWEEMNNSWKKILKNYEKEKIK